MKKKRMILLTATVVSGICLLSGCASVEQSSLMWPKARADETGDYIAAENEPDLNGSEADSDRAQITTDAMTAKTLVEQDSGSGAQVADTHSALRASLGAPEHYQSEAADDTGHLRVLTDARVELPDVDGIPTVAVSQRAFTQERADEITNILLPGMKFYMADNYNQRTKADCEKELEELKAYVAAGNPDPYGWGTDENGDYYYDIEQMIRELEAECAEAPETRQLQEVWPQIEPETEGGMNAGHTGVGQFLGVACDENGNVWNYKIKTYAAWPMQISVEKVHGGQELPENGWRGSEEARSGISNVPDDEALAESAGITLEDAKRLADEKVAALGLDGMELREWEYGINWDWMEQPEYTQEACRATGYLLHYTRNVGGVPVTYTTSDGGGLEDMDSTLETWGYEKLDFAITKDGIDTVYFCNEYDMGDQIEEDSKLLPFDEVMQIFEQMLLLQNADSLNTYASSVTWQIDRIALGYMRVYEPASDSRSGVLVPVWDFFGSRELVTNSTDAGEKYTYHMPGESYLTVNAVDGTVINRALGY